MGTLNRTAKRLAGKRISATRRGPLATAGVLAALLAVACTGDDDGPPTGTDPDAAAMADADPTLPDALAIDATNNGIDAPPSGGADAFIASLCQEPPSTVVEDVSVADLYGHITDGTPLAVVDVREPSETATGIIENALLYPWTSGVLTADHATLPDDVPLFIICRSGNRSAQASAFLVTNGHVCVHNVLGGMNAWTAAEYPTVIP